MDKIKIADLNIRQIEWTKTIALRNEVLWPNESAEFCKVDGDEDALHIGGYLEDKLVSVASLYREGNTVRLRKFATSASFQGEGIGTKMMEYALAELSKSDVNCFWCDARETAISFYQRFNMEPEGGRFYKSDIPYIKMSVSL